MKIKTILFYRLILTFNCVFSQQLTIPETIEYINGKLKEEQEEIKLEKDGTFIYTKYIADFFYDGLSIAEMKKRYRNWRLGLLLFERNLQS